MLILSYLRRDVPYLPVFVDRARSATGDTPLCRHAAHRIRVDSGFCIDRQFMVCQMTSGPMNSLCPHQNDCNGNVEA